MALQGYTKIELTDVETNNTEVYEKHNIVTNALSEIFRPIGYWTSSDVFLSGNDPLVKKYCGGLLCFDKTIPEDKNTLFAPAGTTMTACGVYNEVNSGTNKNRGDSNLVETSISSTDKIAKFVYDFKTTQGNGTIQSICLTSANGGYGFYNSNDATGTKTTNGSIRYSLCRVYPGLRRYVRFISSTESTFYASLDSDVVYSILADSASSIRILTRKAYTSNISLFDNNMQYSCNSKLLSTTTLDVSFPYNQIYNWFDRDSECIWLYANTSRNSAYVETGDTLKLYKVSIRTYNIIESYTIVNSSTTRIALSTTCIYDNRVFSTYTVYEDGYYGRYIQWIGLDDANNTGKSRCETQWYNYAIPLYPVVVRNGKIFYEQDSNYSNLGAGCVFDTNLNVLRETENRTYGENVISVSNSNIGFLIGDSTGTQPASYYCILSNYLATINNLETPITKTSDKTMKITYTLKEVDS